MATPGSSRSTRLSVRATLADVVQAFNALLRVPLLNGAEVLAVSVDTTAKRVPHRLGRPYLGFVVTSRTAASVVYESPPSTANDAEEIWLTSDVPDTVDLWVY